MNSSKLKQKGVTGLAPALTKFTEGYDPGSNRSLYQSLSGAHEYLDEDWLSRMDESQDSTDSSTWYQSNGSCGIDKTRIGISLDADKFELRSLLDTLIKPQNPADSPDFGTANPPNFPEVFVKWDYYNHQLQIEFNPSDLTRGLGLELCPLGLFIPVIELTIRHVLAMDDVWPAFATNQNFETGRYDFARGWTSLVSISRIDLARDFHVTDKRFSLEQLRHTYPNRSRGHSSSQFRNSGILNTLSFPTSDKTVKLKLYDKAAERASSLDDSYEGDLLPKGTFRFEASYPRKYLNKKGMKTLDTFTPIRLEKMLRNKWEDSKYWTNLTWDGQSCLDAHKSGLSLERVNEVIGYVHSEYYGVPMTYTYREKRKLKADSKKLGLKLGVSLSESGKEYGHLDFESGDISRVLPDDFSLTTHSLFGMIWDK